MSGVTTGTYRCELQYQRCLKALYPDGKTRVCCGKRYNPKTDCCTDKKIVPKKTYFEASNFNDLEACVADCMWNETKGNGSATTGADAAAGGAGGMAGGLAGGGIGTLICPGAGTVIGGVIGAGLGGGGGGYACHSFLVSRCKARCNALQDCLK